MRISLICTTGFVLFSLLWPTTAKPQSGNYIKPYWMFQYTNIANAKDFYTTGQTLTYLSTYHQSLGLGYVFNATDIFGLETGFRYSTTGQKYKGSVDDDFNTQGVTDPKDFTSEVTLNYIHLPILFSFNSVLDDDYVYLTISGGFQFDLLQGARMQVDPAPVIKPGGTIDIARLYRKTNVSFITGAIFNIKTYKNFYINSGFLMNRTIGDIENKNFEYDKTIHPVEYYFPVSTKKSSRPDVLVRPSTKNINYGFVLGVSYMFMEIKN